MRCPKLAIVAVTLGGCAAETGPVPDPAAVRAGQEEVCAAVVADHDGMGVEQVTAAWDRATPEGTAIVTVRGPGSLHTCEVDGALRVREVLHPGH